MQTPRMNNLINSSRLIQMGIDLEDKEKHEEALGCFNKVLMRNSKALAFETALSLYFKGSILEKLNKIDEMISCYLELIKLDLEEQDVETIVYVYERTLKQNVPKQMRFLSSDIPIQKTFRKEP